MKTMNAEEARNLSLPQGAFDLVQRDERLSDKKFETKPVSYFQDAMKRFRKNKASIAAAWIILILFLYALIIPFLSPFEVKDREPYFTKVLPKLPFLVKIGAGFWDGASREILNQSQIDLYQGMGEELAKGHGNNAEDVNPIFKKYREIETRTKKGKKEKVSITQEVRLNSYRKLGIIFKNFTASEFAKVCKWQNATGFQILYPVVDAKKASKLEKDNANVYYEVDRQGTAKRDKDGNLIVLYKKADPERYTSLRLEGDPGNWSYYSKTQTGMACRVDYYNYFRYIYSGSSISADPANTAEDVYKVGREPVFYFGTNQHGQDIFTCIAYGARFSFAMATVIALVNFILGAIIGAIEGYYGGATDMIIERIKEIINDVPFMVTIVLFREHLQKHVGIIGTVIFSFILFGWIGTSSLVRTQFYRFKNQEYVLAARTLGAHDYRIMTKHIFPNAIGTIITSSVLVIPSFIFSESSLSYLGIINLGTANTTSVGTLLAGGNAYLQMYPHIIFFPSLFISLLLICFNLFGNGLRDAFNPSLRGADE